MRSFISAFLFLLFLLRYLSPAAAGRPDIILKTCKRCSDSSPNVNYSLCVASLKSVPRSHRSDLRGLGLISVKLAAASAKHARSKVKKLLKAKPRSHYTKSCLKACLELYKDAISMLKASAGAIKSGHYDDANIWISSAVDAPGSCEDGFGEGGVKSPMVKEDKDLFQLAVIALAMTALLG